MSNKLTVVYENNGFRVQLSHLYADKFQISQPILFGMARLDTAIAWDEWPNLRNAIQAEYAKRTGAKEAKR